MPLGKYKTFDECVAANQDKRDPEAYCGSIEQTIKKHRLLRKPTKVDKSKKK